MPGPGDYDLAQDIYKAKLALSKSQKFLSSSNGKPGRINSLIQLGSIIMLSSSMRTLKEIKGKP